MRTSANLGLRFDRILWGYHLCDVPHETPTLITNATLRENHLDLLLVLDLIFIKITENPPKADTLG